MSFRVELDMFRGPLDLLLYLVRKHEVPINEIPIAPITEQFLEQLDVLRELGIDQIGDFLDLASVLIEIKSAAVLPRADEVDEPMDDPRQELVRRLLDYKKYKDAASMLDERSRQWQEHYTRTANDLPPRRRDMGAEPIREIELWDLVSAFGRVLRDTQLTKPSSIVYDETPIHVYMQQVYDRLKDDQRVSLAALFQSGMHKSAMVGMFLAVLELMRHHHITAEQNDTFSDIWLGMHPDATGDADFAPVSDYDAAADADSPTVDE